MDNYILWTIFWDVEYKQLEIRKCLKKRKKHKYFTASQEHKWELKKLC